MYRTTLWPPGNFLFYFTNIKLEYLCSGLMQQERRVSDYGTSQSIEKEANTERTSNFI